jgi:hypothetical protein
MLSHELFTDEDKLWAIQIQSPIEIMRMTGRRAKFCRNAP